MGNYYSLVAGLPDLHPDDQKVQYTLLTLKDELRETLSSADMALVDLFYQKFDNENLLALLNDADAKINPLGTLSKQDLLDIIQLFKEDEAPKDSRIPKHFKDFVPAYINDMPISQELSWQDQLAASYYEMARKSKNGFIADWFEFNLNTTNILTAINCRKFNMDIEKSVIGDNEVAHLLKSNSSKDFGLSIVYPEVSELLHIVEEENLLERERKMDLLKWNWIEEHSVFHYFDIERVYVYLLRIELLERWTVLEKSTGEKIFRSMISAIQNSVSFPSEIRAEAK